LRDGTVASVRVAGPPDRDAVGRFFRDLSPESRRKRFLIAGEPPGQLIDTFCDNSNAARALTLIALRQVGDDIRVVAAASYFTSATEAAEVAFAVDDRFQGKGLGTLLLERLAEYAAAHGLRRFHATTLADNTAMLEVFRDSGFAIRSKLESGVVDVQLSLVPTLEGVAAAERRRHAATVHSMQPMLAPRAVAVVGASRDPRKIGSRILRALQGAEFTGFLYGVNREAPSIEGVPVFKSARELPAGIDLAIVAVPQPSVARVVEDCAAVGVKALVVITAGYAETGAEGRAAQDALVERVRAHGMRMIGPNCLGLLNTNPNVRLNASFSPVFPSAGRVAFSSQSGALGIAILELATARHVGLSGFVSVGNKADVSSNDLIEYWEQDEATRVILLYLESFGNPRRFGRLARRVGRQKPILAIKAGRTRAGSRAAGSHTAALAASDLAVDALFRQSGVIRAATIDEMFDIAVCLDAQPLPKGTRVGIVTNAGGPGILAADACESAGITVADISPDTKARLASFLPTSAAMGNPVDMVASAGGEEYRQAIESLLLSPDIDSLIVIYTPIDPSGADQALEGIRRGITGARGAGATGKPVLACVMAESMRAAPLLAGGEKVPSFAFPENAVRALGKVVAYAGWRTQAPGLHWDFDDIDAPTGRAICLKALAENAGGWLEADDVSRLLRAFGLPVVAGAVAHSADEAAALAAVFGFPAAAKVASTRVLHKTDAGGVRLNLADASEVRSAFSDIETRLREIAPEAASDGVLIQPMVLAGVEAFVGVAHDPTFGSLIGFGLGGVDVELLGDVRFRVAPLTDRDADELLREIRGYPVLIGQRRRPAADLDALREILLRVSRLAEEIPEIAELDLNPVMAMAAGKGCRIVDARVRVAATRA